MGTARVQSALWGARARDWADVQEGTVVSLFEAVLNDTRVGAGTTLLDVGCGAGGFCRMAASLGADVSGLDASDALVVIARERTPRGDFRVGEMEELPFADDRFDVVTGFNSFQFAARPVNALREARRVARPGGAVVVAVWGKPEETQIAPYLAALGSLLPPPPPGAPGPFALSDERALRALVEEAGLTPTAVAAVECLWSYPDDETALRGLLSAGPAVRAIEHAGEQAVRDAVAQAIAPFATAGGGYELRNAFRYLIARA